MPKLMENSQSSENFGQNRKNTDHVDAVGEQPIPWIGQTANGLEVGALAIGLGAGWFGRPTIRREDGRADLWRPRTLLPRGRELLRDAKGARCRYMVFVESPNGRRIGVER
jgi:hypothetical protein